MSTSNTAKSSEELQDASSFFNPIFAWGRCGVRHFVKLDNERLTVEKTRNVIYTRLREHQSILDINTVTAVVGQTDVNTSLPICCLLWLLTGLLGGHRFYCGHYKSGLLLLIGTPFAIVALALNPMSFGDATNFLPLLSTGLALVWLLVAGLIWLTDLCRIPTMVGSSKVKIFFSGGFVEANVERPDTVVDIQNAIVTQRDAIIMQQRSQELPIPLDAV